MTPPLRLIILDTSPLITLAVSGNLDVLLTPGVAIGIPDAVYAEATRIRSADGASVIVGWVNKHREQVHIMPTETGIDQLRRLADGRRINGMGETAALEALNRFLEHQPDASVALLFEDTAMERSRALLGPRAEALSTGDFLRELEGEGLIPSAEQVLDRAAAAGRNISQQREVRSAPDAAGALHQHLQTGMTEPLDPDARQMLERLQRKQRELAAGRSSPGHSSERER